MKVLKNVFHRLLFTMIAIAISGSVLAQQRVTGKVVSSVDGSALAGINVIVPGTTVGTMTDANGNYTIMVPANYSTLRFSFIGFEEQILPVSPDGIVNVTLQEVTTILDEVVVTGYGGTQLRSKLTNSITTVKDDIMKIGIYSNPAQSLSGAVSGLKVVQSSGNPKATPTIILRGGTDFNGSGSPLYLVDGQVRSNLSDINPQDIESIEVLKDAGATAIYGARANNGVVLVATKRGKAGKTEISINSRIGMNYLYNPYTFMNSEDYLFWVRTSVNNAVNVYQRSDGTWVGYRSPANLTAASPFGTGNQYFEADGVTPRDGNKSSLAVWSPMFYADNLAFLLDEGWKTMTDPVTGKEIIFSEFNRSSTAFNKPAITQDHNISITGGNDRGSYYAGFGYNYSQGLPVKTWYSRMNFVFNGDYKIRSWLTSSSSFQYSGSKWYDVTNTSESNYFGRMLSGPPTMREYNAFGQLSLGTSSGDGNPLYNIDKFKRTNNDTRFNLGQTMTFFIMKGLNVKLSGIWLFDDSWRESFNRDYLASPGNINTTRSSSTSFSRSILQTYNAVANYSITIAQNHSLNALAGFEYFDSFNYGTSGSGRGAPTDDFADLQYTSTNQGTRDIDSFHSNERIASAFGRINYDYLSKYLLSVTFRQDGYSKLVGDNRWGFFPGVSAGWVLSKENFMSSFTDIVSFLKLRTSYGQNGNVSGIGAYTLQGSYSSNLYNGNAGYTLGNIANPTLRWEHSSTFEIGADLGFLENRITSNITVYNRLTADKYASIPLPESSGISSVTSNNGSLRNRGIEVDLTARMITAKDFNWEISVNLSHNTNTVMKLPDNGLLRNRQNAFRVYGNNNDTLWVGGYQEGQVPGAIYGFLALGIYQDEEEVLELAGDLKDISSGNNGSDNKTLYGPNLWAAMTDAQKATGLPIQPGDVIYKDVNGDNIIDNFDMVYIGNVNPKLFGGLTSSLSWKGITFYARMDFALGFYQIDTRLPWFMGGMQGTYNSVIETKDTWTPSNPTAKYPKYYNADQLGKRNYARQTSLFMYEASYLSFREISLNYNFPYNLIKKAGIEGLEVSVTGQNLGYWTKSKLNRPELSDSQDAGYSLPRTVIFGVGLKF